MLKVTLDVAPEPAFAPVVLVVLLAVVAAAVVLFTLRAVRGRHR